MFFFLLEKFAIDTGKKKPSFFTPQEVSKLLAKLLNPQAGDTVCDPASGTASLLIHVAKQVKHQKIALYGQEMNGNIWAISKINLFLEQIAISQVEWGDTLREPKLLEDGKLKKFDLIACHPPFKLSHWGAEHAQFDPYKRFERGVPPKRDGHYAFISHMMATAKPRKGKIAVVMPHGVLFRKHKHEYI